MSASASRRSDRVSLTVFLEAEGIDSQSQPFKEVAKTTLISRHGAILILNRALEPGLRIELRRKARHESHRHGLVQIVRKLGELDGGHLYSVAIIDPNNDLWGIEFPPFADSSDALARMLLECSYCRNREVVHLSEMELKGFETNRGIARHCKACGVPTIWIQAHHEHLKKDSIQGNGTEPRTDASGESGSAERRHSARTKAHLTVCIRPADSDDELAVSEEISLGGMSFRSRRRFSPGTRVDVAVPYTEGSANIFVPARIIHSEEIPNAGLFRHGIEYLKSGQLLRKSGEPEHTNAE